MLPRAAIRLGILAWLAAFLWWCSVGASLFLAAREHDEPSMWVGPLSVPWGILGGLIGGLALWKPTRWTIGAFGLVMAAQVLLSVFSW